MVSFQMKEAVREIELLPLSVGKDELLTEMAHYYKNPGVLLGLQTGYTEVDEATGGLEPGELTICAARPGMGKTQLADNIKDNVARRLRAAGDAESVVLDFSQEMPRKQKLRRWAAMVSGVPWAWIRRGYYVRSGQMFKTEQRHFTAFRMALEDIASLPVLMYCGTLTTAEMDRAIQRVIADGKTPRLIIDDYLGLHSDSYGDGNLNVKMTHVSRNVTELTIKYNVPVFALHQLSRNVERREDGNRIPELSDIRDSGSLEQDAANVWFPFRPGYYAADQNGLGKDEREEMFIYHKKSRNGEAGLRTKLRAHIGSLKITDWEVADWRGIAEIAERAA